MDSTNKEKKQSLFNAMSKDAKSEKEGRETERGGKKRKESGKNYVLFSRPTKTSLSQTWKKSFGS